MQATYSPQAKEITIKAKRWGYQDLYIGLNVSEFPSICWLDTSIGAPRTEYWSKGGLLKLLKSHYVSRPKDSTDDRDRINGEVERMVDECLKIAALAFANHQ